MLIITPFGRATSLSGISPYDSVVVVKSLQLAKSKLIMKSGLHPIFLVTPPYPPIEPKWDKYVDIVVALYDECPVRFIYVEIGDLVR